MSGVPNTAPFTKPCYSKCTLHAPEVPAAIVAAKRRKKLMARQPGSRCNLWIAIVQTPTALPCSMISVLRFAVAHCCWQQIPYEKMSKLLSLPTSCPDVHLFSIL